MTKTPATNSELNLPDRPVRDSIIYEIASVGIGTPSKTMTEVIYEFLYIESEIRKSRKNIMAMQAGFFTRVEYAMHGTLLDKKPADECLAGKNPHMVNKPVACMDTYSVDLAISPMRVQRRSEEGSEKEYVDWNIGKIYDDHRLGPVSEIKLQPTDKIYANPDDLNAAYKRLEQLCANHVRYGEYLEAHVRYMGEIPSDVEEFSARSSNGWKFSTRLLKDTLTYTHEDWEYVAAYFFPDVD